MYVKDHVTVKTILATARVGPRTLPIEFYNPDICFNDEGYAMLV